MSPPLPCQLDAYLRNLEAEVLECTPTKGCFEVVLSETPLYPESGGQPSDQGTVAGIPVRSLSRRPGPEGAVLHCMPSALWVLLSTGLIPSDGPS